MARRAGRFDACRVRALTQMQTEMVIGPIGIPKQRDTDPNAPAGVGWTGAAEATAGEATARPPAAARVAMPTVILRFIIAPHASDAYM